MLVSHDVNVTYRVPVTKLEEPKTVIVVGPSRSGTSMVSGLVKLLGVYMGEQTNRTHEDKRFLRNVPIDEKLNTIKKRNEQYSSWGWKMPAAKSYITDLYPHLRNPYFVVSVRNPINICLSKNNRTGDPELHKIFNSSLKYYSNIVSTINDFGCPLLLANYDLGLVEPEKYTQSLSEFLSISPSAAQKQEMLNFMSNKDYTVIEQETLDSLGISYK